MSDRLQRAMAEALITLLDEARNHPGGDDLIDRKTIEIRVALDESVPPPAGPPGCECMEKTRASGYRTGFDCQHCRPNGGYPV